MGRGRPLGGALGFVCTRREASHPFVPDREGAKARRGLRSGIDDGGHARIATMVPRRRHRQAHPCEGDSRVGGAMYLGAHVSIAESIALAPERGKAVGAHAIQIFSRSPRMLRKTKPIPPEEAKAFQEAMPANGIARAIIHANYLINLAGPDDNTLNYSRLAFVEELDRAQVLGIRDVIFHPGAHLGKGEAHALKTIAASLDWSLDHSEAPDVFAVLEITAGQGSVVGYTFAQLAEIMKACSHPERLAVCIDTCHTFAAGYDFRTR